jgi:zinc protease
MRTPLIRSLCCAAVLGAALASTSHAQQELASPPPPGPPRPVAIASPTEQRLPNGLRVVVAERHGVPLVTARLFVLSGAELDTPGHAGLASLTAGLLPRGTRHHTAPVLARMAEALGGSIESQADWDSAAVGMTVMTPMLPSALSLLAEVAMEPAFSPEEIERYRAQALDAMKVSYSQPGSLATLVAERAVFGDGAYAHPPNGTPRSLPRIGREDLLRAHEAAYRPDNAVLVFAGDISAEQALQLARQHFGRWKAPATPLPKPSAAATSAGPGRVLVIDMPGAGQAGVTVAWPASPSSAPDRLAGAVANAVLGGGYSSRLNQEIRIKRGLSYGAGARYDPRRLAGLMEASAQTKNPSAAEVVGLIEQQLDDMMGHPVSDDELNARRAQLIGSFSRALETTDGLAQEVGGLVVDGLPLTELTQRVGLLEAVKPQQVQAFAQTHFGREQRRIAVAGVAADFVPALVPLTGEPRVLPQAELDLEGPLPAATAH